MYEFEKDHLRVDLACLAMLGYDEQEFDTQQSNDEVMLLVGGKRHWQYDQQCAEGNACLQV